MIMPFPLGGISQVQTTNLVDGAVTNAKVNTTAAIAMSKLNLAITNSQIAAAAAILRSKIDTYVPSDVTASRSVNTVYQNTSDKDMILLISASNDGGLSSVYFDIYADASNPPTTLVARAGIAYRNQVVAIVPRTYYYKYVPSAGATTILSWIEVS